MVRITGKSLESLYRYLAGEIGGKAPAGHEHTQAQVAGLPDALNGKAAAKHEHAQADVTGLLDSLSKCVSGKNKTGVTNVTDPNDIWKSGFYEVTQCDKMPDRSWYWIAMLGHSSNSESYHYGELIACRIDDGAIFTMNRMNSEATTITADRWKRVYRAGDKMICYKGGKDFTVGGTGWTYQSHQDNYFQRLAWEESKGEYNAVVDGNFGAHCPIIGVRCENGQILVFAAEPPIIDCTFSVFMYSRYGD